jgi:hypothetical protein
MRRLPGFISFSSGTSGDAAEFLGWLDRLGTIEIGKFADLVLLDANPLEDIANTRQIAAVVVDGRLLEKSILETLLARAEATANTQSHVVPILLSIAGGLLLYLAAYFLCVGVTEATEIGVRVIILPTALLFGSSSHLHNYWIPCACVVFGCEGNGGPGGIARLGPDYRGQGYVLPGGP